MATALLLTPALWPLVKLRGEAATAGLATTEAASQEHPGEIAIGDSAYKVISILGSPRGRLSRGHTEIFYYGERGSVTLRDGKVISSKIVTEEEGRKRAERSAREAAERQITASATRAARIAEGTAAKAGKDADKAFRQLPARKRLAYWREFEKTYPEVSVSAEISAAATEMGEQEKAEKLGNEAFLKSAPQKRLAYWRSFSKKYPEVPVASEIAGAEKELNEAEQKELNEKIQEIEEAIKEASVIIRTRGMRRIFRRQARHKRARLSQELKELQEQRQRLLSKGSSP